MVCLNGLSKQRITMIFELFVVFYISDDYFNKKNSYCITKLRYNEAFDSGFKNLPCEILQSLAYFLRNQIKHKK